MNKKNVKIVKKIIEIKVKLNDIENISLDERDVT